MQDPQSEPRRPAETPRRIVRRVVSSPFRAEPLPLFHAFRA